MATIDNAGIIAACTILAWHGDVSREALEELAPTWTSEELEAFIVKYGPMLTPLSGHLVEYLQFLYDPDSALTGPALDLIIRLKKMLREE